MTTIASQLPLLKSAAEPAADFDEARKLDRSGRDCYVATSRRFLTSDRHAWCRRPILDQQQLAAGSHRPTWPNGAPFAVCLTHDVDSVARYVPVMHLRQMRNQLPAAARGFELRAVRGLRASIPALLASLLKSRQTDPLHCYERWLDMEAAVGARSTFLFLPDQYGRRHYSDGGYRYYDRVVFDGQSCTVAEMMREIHRRGWEIGLHASWHSFDSVEEMKRQKAQVEQAIDKNVVSVRHHHLHFDVRTTPRVHHEAGLTVDSSIGLNDEIGFRYGTSYPWLLRDVPSGEALNVLELPLVIQDKCLLRNLARGHMESSLRLAEQLACQVRQVGGLLTLLWHPETIRIPLFVEVYQHLLTSLRDQGAWFGTMAEVADWWKNKEPA